MTTGALDLRWLEEVGFMKLRREGIGRSLVPTFSHVASEAGRYGTAFHKRVFTLEEGGKIRVA
jgi:hypothetical protein